MLAALVLAGCTDTPPAGPDPGAVNSGRTYLVEYDVPVAMRDRTILRADIYKPPGTGRYPVLVYRTPYGKASAATSYNTHLAAVARGYAVVLQDVRGRYASEGLFEPYRNEGRDGYDTIEWASKQPWSDGRVGTYGLSYPGAVQWLAAVEAPPHLRAMAPAMTYSTPRNFVYMNGVFDLSWLPWIYLNIAPDTRRRLGLTGIRSEEDAERTWPAVAERYLSHRPLADLPYLRQEAPFYFQWLQHAPDDHWWDWAEIRGRYARVDAAVLNLSGWHDEAYGPEGAISNYLGLLQTRKKLSHPRAHLVLGPWKHGVGAVRSRRTGDLDFGPAAAIDYDELLLRFFDHYVAGHSNGFEAEPPISYFVMGANEWRKASSWPPKTQEPRVLFLSRSSGEKDGELSWTRVDTSHPNTSFLADPTNPVTDPHGSFGPHDFQVLACRDDVLVFDTPPLDADLEVAGAATAIIYVSCDCPDLDLWVKMLDVYPDGRAMSLMSPGADVLRASYRDPEQARQLLEKDRVYELRLSGLLTGNRFLAGHRLRLQISASFAPHLSGNLQTGALEMTSRNAAPATVTIHHDIERPSSLLLPASGSPD